MGIAPRQIGVGSTWRELLQPFVVTLKQRLGSFAKEDLSDQMVGGDMRLIRGKQQAALGELGADGH